MSSSRWPSKPALTKIISGLKASSRGSQSLSISARMAMPGVYAGTGRFSMFGAGDCAPPEGYHGRWNMPTITAGGPPARMSSVPLPWCTSKSTTATRCIWWRCIACLAATATLLKKQKPMALSRQAGGAGDGGVGGGGGGGGGARGGLPGVGVQGGVGVDARVIGPARLLLLAQPLGHAAQRGDMSVVVGAFDVGQRGLRGLVVREHVGPAGDQQVVCDGVEPFGAFRVAGAHFVFAAIAVGEVARFAHSRFPWSGIFSDMVAPYQCTAQDHIASGSA